VVGGITLGPPAGYGAQPRRVRGQRQLTVSGSWDQALGHLGRGGNAALGEQEGNLMRVAADPAVVSRLAYPGHDRAVRATDVSRAGTDGVKNLRTGQVGFDPRRVRIPVLPIEDQRTHGAAFRRLADLVPTLRAAHDEGNALIRDLIDATVSSISADPELQR
jgi:hypothetical protein